MPDFSRVFAQYKRNYETIFRVFYPSKNSTGFTERNLSVNFCKAYEALHPAAVSWYEYHFGEKNHYDALIIDPQEKEILLIESKRFSYPNKKLAEISSDIDRINGSVAVFPSEFERIEEFGEYRIFGVILADVWTETKQKREILDAFRKGDFLEKLLLSENADAAGNSDPTYYIADFDSSEKYPAIRDKYHLTSMVWRVR